MYRAGTPLGVCLQNLTLRLGSRGGASGEEDDDDQQDEAGEGDQRQPALDVQSFAEGWGP